MIHVVHIIPTLGQGGAERVLSDICSHPADGQRHSIVTLFDEIFFRPPDTSISTLGLPRDNSVKAAISLVRSSGRLRSLLAGAGADIIQGWLYYGNVATLLVRQNDWPIVWSIHNTNLSLRHSNPVLFLANIAAMAMSSSVPDRIVYCAETARAVHEKQCYARYKGIVIRNGVDRERFQPNRNLREEMRAQLGIAADEFLVGIFGRFDPQKNLPFQFGAIARARHALGRFRLVLAGREMNASNAALAALLQKSGLAGQTLFLGEVENMEAVLNASDVVLIGSRYGEALPMIGLEALACQVPIVMTDLSDLAKAGTGVTVVAKNDLPGFAQAIIGVSQRLSRKEQPAVAGPSLMLTSLEECRREYAALYEVLMTEKRPC